MFLVDKCICGSIDFYVNSKFGIDCATCKKCGIVHQEVLMDEHKYLKWYEDTYPKGIYTHSYSQDKDTAKKRLNVYGELGKSLDIGAGNGAFVDEAIKQGNDTYGVELYATANSRIYTGELSSHNFPTDYFDTLTCHDVLEHVISPTIFLNECFRISKQGGRIVVDFPDFFSDAGQKHWKKIEHIWLLNPQQLIKLINDCGFTNATVSTPVPGKLTVIAYKPVQNRPSILVPPGIGDIYWVMVKLKSFLEKNKLPLPNIFISAPDGKRRSIDYVQSLPFVNAAGYHSHTVCNEQQESYLRDARTIFKGLMGFDWFIGYNGPMRFSKSLEQIEPEYKCDWFLPVFKPIEYRNYGKEFERYIVVYFTPHGMYNRWVSRLNPERVHGILTQISDRLNCKIVAIGSNWDETPYINEIRARGRIINLVGSTSYHEMMALIRNSIGVFGFPAGNTIMSVVERVPTLLLTEEYFTEEFYKNMCPPLSLERWYKPRNVKTEDSVLINDFVSLCE